MMQYKIQTEVYTLEALKIKCDKVLLDINLPEWEREIWLFIQFFIDEKVTYFINKTSGSTGIPKEIIILKKHAIASATKTISFFQLQKNDRLHLCMHAKYIGAKMMIVRALIGEMQLTYSEPKADALSEIDIPVDFCACVPLQLVQMLEKNSLGNIFIKTLLIGGGAVDEKIKSRLENHTTNYYQSFGMTETISHIALQQININATSYQALDGIHITKNENNCLIIDAPDIGVHHLLTNDIIELGDENKFIWLGRFDNIINSGGIKINPEVLEQKIQHLINQPFIISSLPDSKLGNKLVLIIETNTVNKEDLFSQLQQGIDKYEVPKEIYFLPQFCYTETNKIKRKETTDLIM